MFRDDVWRYLPLGPVPTVVVGLVGLGLLVTVGLRSSTVMRRLAASLLAVATLSILAFTLSGGGLSSGREANLVPGTGIHLELANINRALGLVNVFGNIVLFVPFGWLVATLVAYSPRVEPWAALRRATLAGLGLSLLIEALQYTIGRAADVDDVLLNTAGALLGALVGLWLSRIRRRTGPTPTHPPA